MEGVWSRGEGEGLPGGDLPRMTTAAGSMEPTGMHSCLICIFSCL